MQCFTSSKRVECATDCMVDDAKISEACGECWGERINCAIQLCSVECSPPTDPDCKACTSANCEPTYHLCAGL
jgi:hypothetical protein